MRSRPIRHLIAAATSVVALAAAGALLVPASAFAATDNINTNSIRWQGVDDTTGYIYDASNFDFANNAYGWNAHALEGLPDPFTLTDSTQGSWKFVANVRSVSDIHQGGTSVITMTGETTGGTTVWDHPYTVVLTLTLTGNYAHWAYTMSNPTIGLANSSVLFTGNIGSGSTTEYAVKGNTLVSDDSGISERYPVIGYNVVTDGNFGGWTATAGNNKPRATASAASQFDVYLVLFGYTPCANGFADARTAVTALVPTLPASFGDRYNDAGNCITVAPVSLTTGVAVNQVLTYTVDPALTSFNYFTPGGVFNVVDGLPAGLTATSVQQPDGSFIVTISGTPTSAGSFTARLLFAQDNSESGRDSEVLANVAITVADPPVEPAPELAATGTSATGPIGLGGLLLLTGLGLAAVARRRLV